MVKFKLKTGDNVKVITGEHKGSEGVIQRIDKEKQRVIVEGVNLVSKHQKPSANNPQGGIVEKEAPIHISNVALIDPKSSEATRVRIEMREGKKVRIAVKSNEEI